MTEKLSQILQAKGVEASKILAAYFMNIGGVLIQSPRLDFASADDSHAEARDWEACISSIYKEIIHALKRHPNILEVKALTNIRGDVSWGTAMGWILEGSPVKLHLNLPTAIQKYSAHAWITNPIESFDVIINGSIFAAYTQINDWPCFAYIAHEFRGLFQEHISSTTQCKVPRFGPSPIHPNFYIVIVGQSAFPPELIPVFEAEGDLFILAPNNYDIEEIVLHIMISVRLPLARFYSVAVERIRLVDHTMEIHNSFEHLIQLLRQPQETKWYRLLNRIYPGKQVIAQITHIYEVIFTAQASQFYYDESRRDIRDLIIAQPYLAPMVKYFEDELDNVLVLPESLFPALEHFAEHVRSVAGTRIALIATLIGAAVGPILTAILTS